ncbi:hypothetical protein [Allorhodopirellula solitaria]|uniref:Uncharacterized protein n=1 Tax=Allorhodopirellula solitaria TaxID=2527987 RepID=A0A5C5X0R2_9BACT|nr:hypothetical protein [Allorhodopirellula solitaria]TWT56448.1 hypothetical protein CA85_42610 [Allorhodopirellula solitaria]
MRLKPWAKEIPPVLSVRNNETTDALLSVNHACVPECPAEAIFYEDDEGFIELNATKAAECPSAHD